MLNTGVHLTSQLHNTMQKTASCIQYIKYLVHATWKYDF